MEGSRPGSVRLPSPRLAALSLALAMISGTVADAATLRIGNRWSDLNRYRDRRAQTDYIVLHTTEGHDGPSLDRVRKGGLAHYIVMRDGRVYRIIKRQLEARHAGRSMWDSRENLDQRSIGIEVVGYHNRDLKPAQITALAELLRQLQSVYDIPDDRVLTHSMVAYGAPNRWHRHSHRGRKRCGMQFAQPELRARLGLTARPLADPDVLAGRLVEADPYLARVLYAPEAESEAVAAAEFAGPDVDVISATRTAWFIARDEYDSPATVYVFPSGKQKRGNEIKDWSRMPVGTKVLLGQDVVVPGGGSEPARMFVTLKQNEAASEAVGEAYDAGSTVYVRPDGKILRGDVMTEGDFRRLPAGTRVFLGFEYAGKVTARHTAYELCGPRYREGSTLYLMPGGRVKDGTEIRERGIPGGTHVLVGS